MLGSQLPLGLKQNPLDIESATPNSDAESTVFDKYSTKLRLSQQQQARCSVPSAHTSLRGMLKFLVSLFLHGFKLLDTGSVA